MTIPNSIVLLIIFFVSTILILGTDHIKGIIVYIGIMIISIFVVSFIGKRM